MMMMIVIVIMMMLQGVTEQIRRKSGLLQDIVNLCIRYRLDCINRGEVMKMTVMIMMTCPVKALADVKRGSSKISFTTSGLFFAAAT